MARILKGALSEEQIERVLADFVSTADARLANIGVDSLAFFSVIENIEDICGNTLDYGAVDFEALNSLNGILAYIGENGDAD